MLRHTRRLPLPAVMGRPAAEPLHAPCPLQELSQQLGSLCPVLPGSDDIQALDALQSDVAAILNQRCFGGLARVAFLRLLLAGGQPSPRTLRHLVAIARAVREAGCQDGAAEALVVCCAAALLDGIDSVAASTQLEPTQRAALGELKDLGKQAGTQYAWEGARFLHSRGC